MFWQYLLGFSIDRQTNLSDLLDLNSLSSTYSYVLETWMSQKMKMINQLGEIWNLEESHPVSKTSELWDCSHWKVRGFPWLKTFGRHAVALWPCNKDKTIWAGWFTSDNILCLLPLAFHSDLTKLKLFPLSVMTLELAQKIPSAFFLPADITLGPCFTFMCSEA